MHGFISISLILLNSITYVVDGNNIDSLYKKAKEERSIPLIEKGIVLAESKEDYGALAKLYFLRGYFEKQDGMYYQALNAYFEALKYYRIEENNTRQYSTLKNMAVIFEIAHFGTEAISLLEEALSIAHQLGDESAIASIYYNKARVVRMSGDYLTAFNLYQDALVRFKAQQNTYLINETYAELGLLKEQQGDLQAAMMYYATPLQVGENGKDTYAQVRQLNNIAHCMIKANNNIDSAQFILHQAIAISKEDYLTAKAYAFLAKSYELKGDMGSAIEMYEKAFQYADRKNYSPEYINTVKLIADYYQKRNPKKAARYNNEIYQYAKELTEVNEQLDEAYIRYQVEAAKFRHESQERYSAQIRDRYISYIIYSILGFIIILMFITISWYRKKQRAKAVLRRVGAA